MDIKSPNERAQHIAGMAYRHIYIPSEKGKRVEVLLGLAAHKIKY